MLRAGETGETEARRTKTDRIKSKTGRLQAGGLNLCLPFLLFSQGKISKALPSCQPLRLNDKGHQGAISSALFRATGLSAGTGQDKPWALNSKVSGARRLWVNMKWAWASTRE